MPAPVVFAAFWAFSFFRFLKQRDDKPSLKIDSPHAPNRANPEFLFAVPVLVLSLVQRLQSAPDNLLGDPSVFFLAPLVVVSCACFKSSTAADAFSTARVAV